MRASLVNEIKKSSDKNPLQTLGLGKANMLKGYYYLKNFRPNVIEEDTNVLEDIKNIYLDNIKNDIAAKVFGCSASSILFIHKRVSPIAVDLWFMEILEDPKIYSIKVPDMHGKYIVKIEYSEKYNVAELSIIELDSKYTNFSGDKNYITEKNISTLYLIKYL